MADRTGSVVIEGISPLIDCGHSAVKRIVGDTLHVEADLIMEGHEAVAGAVLVRQVSPKTSITDWDATAMRPLGNDRWAADVMLNREGRFELAVEAWPEGKRSHSTRAKEHIEAMVERPRAEEGAWYEFFPRSVGPAGKHGTWKDAEAFLPYVRELGFDVVYLPPIHPIGVTGRKGRNNTPRAKDGDVGSPWAIGGREGGHKAIHPALGTLDDFRRFVARARTLDLEVALDLAYQCSPDHPYVKDHPKWFQWRPDGSLKTAENPPKRYEDVAGFDWDTSARQELWDELKSVVLFWVNEGVRIFRMDNPHTKPVPFWRWLIREVRDVHPDVVFLSEAFTRPKLMKALGKAGFSQSYTYFTWRNSKQELQSYLEELTRPPASDFFRGALWPNTPDILPEALQRGGPPVFKIRLALAATLSSTYGVYSGYELCEGRALPNGEEYADSEKYQLTQWDWDRPGNIRAFMSTLNRIRRENPALLRYRNLAFHRCDNDLVLFYGKRTPDRSSQVLVAVSLDPFNAQTAMLEVPLEEMGLPKAAPYTAEELLTGRTALWSGDRAQVTLTPDAPAAIFRVRPFTRSERSFDYY